MKVGLIAPLNSPYATRQYLIEMAKYAEQLSFDSLWVPEHVLLFDQFESKYPYSENGEMMMPIDWGPLEPFTTLAFLAAVTKKIRLGTGICIVPQRNPVYTAKEVAAIDWLSEGRFDFGVGLGWLREEFDALGVDFSKRGERTVDYVKLMQTLWSQEISVYQGKYCKLPPSRQYPKPLQTPFPPIYFGGNSEAALERVAKIGQGWYAFNMNADTLSGHIDKLKMSMAEKGRAMSEIKICVTPVLENQLDLEEIKRFQALDIDQIILPALGMDVHHLHSTLDGYAALRAAL